jgi:hypothetical protein
VKYEVVKMLGNLWTSEAYLATWNSDRVLSGNPRLRYIAHWAYQRTSGKVVAYDPLPELWTADVSINDITD